jgi:hypothetical protein
VLIAVLFNRTSSGGRSVGDISNGGWRGHYQRGSTGLRLGMRLGIGVRPHRADILVLTMQGGASFGVSGISAVAEFSFCTPSAPPSTYTFKLTRQVELFPSNTWDKPILNGTAVGKEWRKDW